MTTQETNVSAAARDALDAKGKVLLDVYRIHLDVWKVQNDNYFKRVQLSMVVIQTALFAAAFRFLPPKPGSWYENVILMCISVLGILSAFNWTSLINRQNQYLEFCRRTLRNLEARLVELDIPLRYFTLEAHVFGPMRTEITNSTGTCVRKQDGRDVVHFAWSNEDFPDTENKEAKIYELKKVAGGMKAFEKKIAWVVCLLWTVGLTFLICAAIVRGVCP
jgi:hypothetical protein